MKKLTKEEREKVVRDLGACVPFGLDEDLKDPEQTRQELIELLSKLSPYGLGYCRKTIEYAYRWLDGNDKERLCLEDYARISCITMGSVGEGGILFKCAQYNKKIVEQAQKKIEAIKKKVAKSGKKR